LNGYHKTTYSTASAKRGHPTTPDSAAQQWAAPQADPRRRSYRRDTDHLKAALGADVLHIAQVAGARLTVEEAVAQALAVWSPTAP
jgi:hypothetical protein